MITKSKLVRYTKKLQQAINDHSEIIKLEKLQQKADLKKYGTEYMNKRKEERKAIIEQSTNAIYQEADNLIETLKRENQKYIEEYTRKGDTLEYQKKLKKYMMLFGNKPNKKIVEFMADNRDLDGLKFIAGSYDTETNCLIDSKIKELEYGYEPVVNIINMLEQGKKGNMYDATIDALITHIDTYAAGLMDIKPLTPDEVREYKDYLKNGGDPVQEKEIALQLFNEEFEGDK